MYKHQLCPAEIVLILNAKESSTFFGQKRVQSPSRQFQGHNCSRPVRKALGSV